MNKSALTQALMRLSLANLRELFDNLKILERAVLEDLRSSGRWADAQKLEDSWAFHQANRELFYSMRKAKEEGKDR